MDEGRRSTELDRENVCVVVDLTSRYTTPDIPEGKECEMRSRKGKIGNDDVEIRMLELNRPQTNIRNIAAIFQLT